MSAHVLLILFNELGKSDKMRGLLLCNKFNKFNNAGAGMSDSIFHMTIKLLLNCVFCMKKAEILSYICNVITDVNI